MKIRAYAVLRSSRATFPSRGKFIWHTFAVALDFQRDFERVSPDPLCVTGKANFLTMVRRFLASAATPFAGQLRGIGSALVGRLW